MFKNFDNYLKNKSLSRSTNDDDRKKIWLDLPYNGKLGEKLVTFLIKKLKHYFKENLNIVAKNRRNKLSMFCPTKDRIRWNQKSKCYTHHSISWLSQ